MHFKQEALKTRQSPLQKAIGWGENALKFVGTARAIYEAGKTVYNVGQAAVPYLQGAAALF